MLASDEQDAGRGEPVAHWRSLLDSGCGGEDRLVSLEPGERRYGASSSASAARSFFTASAWSWHTRGSDTPSTFAISRYVSSSS